ncbi:E3 ubiquitin-protein ligase RNF8-like isoform X2 [Gordionus sp. m RMFG-2023]|uniref:E3 ubiquitin-protein ligase RNF8-like isoform X2 n=1 Tax=Gordionus sp. m RMFG-2023 TaxID=3053472 RepID=UPI0031FC86B4
MAHAFLIPLSEDAKGLILNSQIEITIGRSCTATYSFPVKNISKNHVSILYNNGKWELSDLGSLNGSYLNKVKIVPFESYELKEKDIIYLAKPFLFKFTTDPFKFSAALDRSLNDSSSEFDSDEYIKSLKTFEINEQDKFMAKSGKHLHNHADNLLKEECSAVKKIKLTKETKISENDSPSEKHFVETDSENNEDKHIATIIKKSSKGDNKPHQILIRSDQAHTIAISLTDITAGNIKPNLAGQLKSEILAKDELISVLTKESNLRKKLIETERLEYKTKINKDYQINLTAKEVEIVKLLEVQGDLTKSLTAIKNEGSIMKEEMSRLNEQLSQSCVDLDQKRKEMEELMANKIQLEINLSQCEHERLEFLKNFETSINPDNEEMRRKITSLIENDFQCVICQETLIKATAINCSHIFCCSCLDTWLQTKRECPVCREGYYSKCRVLALDNYLDNLGDKMLSKEWNEKRKELKKSREDKLKGKNLAATTSRNRNSTRQPQPNNSGNGSFLSTYLDFLTNTYNSSSVIPTHSSTTTGFDNDEIPDWMLLQNSGTRNNRRRQNSVLNDIYGIFNQINRPSRRARRRSIRRGSIINPNPNVASTSAASVRNRGSRNNRGVARSGLRSSTNLATTPAEINSITNIPRPTNPPRRDLQEILIDDIDNDSDIIVRRRRNLRSIPDNGDVRNSIWINSDIEEIDINDVSTQSDSSEDMDIPLFPMRSGFSDIDSQNSLFSAEEINLDDYSFHPTPRPNVNARIRTRNNSSRSRGNIGTRSTISRSRNNMPANGVASRRRGNNSNRRGQRN